MPTQPSKGPEIKIPKLGGIDLRSGRNALESGRCDRIFGLYPEKTGSLSRMPGKQLWRVFEDGTTARPVYQCYQAFDGTGNVIIQNGDAISVYTLDELRNRSRTFSLTPTEGTGQALLGYYNSTNGGGIGASTNTFYAAPVLVVADSSEDAVILSCNASLFRLGLGTYRIDGFVTLGLVQSGMARAGLYNVTNGAFQTHIGSSAEILGLSVRAALPVNGPGNQLIPIKGRFQVTQASETFAIYLATSPAPSPVYAAGAAASGVTGALNFYNLIRIYRE
jgi:hypothetical protein